MHALIIKTTDKKEKWLASMSWINLTHVRFSE